MNILDMLAALVTAVLAGTGVGGGGLYVIYLTSVNKATQSDAQAINLVFFVSAAVCALSFHLRGRRLPLKIISVCTAIGCIGTVFGGFLRKNLDEGLLQTFFGILLIAIGITTLIGNFGRIMHKRPPRIDN